MSGPSLTLRLPPRWLFAFPPDPVPLALPPPTDARTFASPFPIDAKLFNDALDWKVPVTIGAVYATTAIFMNRINRERGNKPWGFSKTAAFHYFVLAHNIFLAVFSALTFVGMIRALAHSWPGNRELYIIGKWWPGLRTQNGLAGAADALCKMHGPRGIGDATYYDPHTHTWLNKNPNVLLAANGAPENSDVGRLWNEGLAFWGWWFYLSKFYEVLDTFIILAKGKRSSTLQTYHHTGAMACMWAGIRYMSPPIWMFCFLNSGIHAMMYTYYTLSALRIKVPQRIKRTLTTMQISQFLIGMTFAGLHLFVHYTVPVSVPITVTETISSAISSASAAVASVASEASSAVAAGATAGLMDGLKKALFRAAGEEGLAENVGRRTREPALSRPSSIPGHQIRKQTHMHTAYQEIPCIDTQGQAFAVWLNLIYLAPLTLLFVRFFIRSYTRRGSPSTKHQTDRRRGQKAIADAVHGVDRELKTLGSDGAAPDSAPNGKKHTNGSAQPNGRHHSAGNDQAAHDEDAPLSPTLHTPRQPERNEALEAPRSSSSCSDKRRVSSTIERIAQTFAKGSDEAVQEERRGSGSVRVLRQKASEGHENLRRRFEEGAKAVQPRSEDTIRRQASSSSMRGASAKDDDSKFSMSSDVIDRLADQAEEMVKRVKRAVETEVSVDHVDDEESDGAEHEASSESGVLVNGPGFSPEELVPRSSSPRKSRIPLAKTRSASPMKKGAKESAPGKNAEERTQDGTTDQLMTNGKSTQETSPASPRPRAAARGASSRSLNDGASSDESRVADDEGVGKAGLGSAEDKRADDNEQASSTTDGDEQGARGRSPSRGASAPASERRDGSAEGEGLSTDDPREVGVSYADMLHKGDAEKEEKGEKEGLSADDPRDVGVSYANMVQAGA